LTVNIDKTAVLIFNKTGRLLLESHQLKYGNTRIPSARHYCYLGIVFNLNGTFKAATEELRKKGLRAYFALKSMIDLSALSPTAVFKLFDALILPVLSYGCQIWAASSHITAAIINNTSSENFMKQVALDPAEKVHIKFLKWVLQVNKKCSNAACYGDTGRYPLLIKLTKQISSYYTRLYMMDVNDENNLVRYAFHEQREQQLSWYKNMTKLITLSGHEQDNVRPHVIQDKLSKLFDGLWNNTRQGSSKLQFYNSVKPSSSIYYEQFLDLHDRNARKWIMKLRCSNHNLHCEQGRYLDKVRSSCKKSGYEIYNNHDLETEAKFAKRCRFCSSHDNSELFHLPGMPDPIIEDELHVLITCPRHHSLRLKLHHRTRSLLLRNESHHELFYEPHLKPFSLYVMSIFCNNI